MRNIKLMVVLNMVMDLHITLYTGHQQMFLFCEAAVILR